MSSQNKNSEYKKQAYQIVSFFVDAKPADFDQAKPGPAGLRAAAEMFQFSEADFHAAHGGRFNGVSRYGWQFEVYVRAAAAEGLLGRNHPNVLGIFE